MATTFRSLLVVMLKWGLTVSFRLRCLWDKGTTENGLYVTYDLALREGAHVG